MTLDEEIHYLWTKVIPGKSSGWQNSNFPVIQDSSAGFKRAWKKARTQKRLSNNEAVTVQMIELQWQAEARARKHDRESRIFVPQPVGASAYCNQCRWDIFIIPTDKIKAEARKCRCGRDTLGPKLPECDHCITFDEQGRFKTNMMGRTELGTPIFRNNCAEQLREYYQAHPEIKMFNREQAVNFIKQKMKKIG